MDHDRWVAELRSRQRNIVFPDTVRNEGHFYRNLVYRDDPLNLVQKIGTLMFAAGAIFAGLFVLVVGAVAVASSRDETGAFNVVSLFFGLTFGLAYTGMALLDIIVGWRLAAALIRRAKTAVPVSEEK